MISWISIVPRGCIVFCIGNVCNSIGDIYIFLRMVLTFCAGTYTVTGLNHFVVFIITFGFNLSEIFKVLWTFYMLRLVGKPSVQYFATNSV